MKYPLVIFDFDGTLANSLPQFAHNLHRLADQYGFRKLSTAEMEELRSVDLRQLLRTMKISFWKLPFIVRRIRKMMNEQINQISLFPGIDQSLQRLVDSGIRLAIVSSNSQDNVQQILGPVNSKRFQFMECSVSLFGKRSRLRRVLRNAQVAAEQAIYVADELRDLQAAKAEKLAFGAVSWGYVPGPTFSQHHPDELFDSAADMTDKLTR